MERWVSVSPPQVLPSSLYSLRPGDLMGRESGLENVRIKNKIRVIRQALTNNRPDPGDPIDVLAKVGGLDIAALVGFYIGCAQLRMPVILDGFISLSAAVIATRLNPLVTYYLFASHAPKEPGGVFALRALEKTGYLNFGLENGDGSGGLTLLPLLRMGLSAYEERKISVRYVLNLPRHFKE